MLFITQTIETEEVNNVNDYLETYENQVSTGTAEESCVSKYITSLVSGQYQKSIEDIANTKIGNKIVRKKNLQQVMRESFFYGANRFGTNFIA